MLDGVVMSEANKNEVTIAGIDCGTNSIRLKISKVRADGTVEDVVPRMLRVIRLGQDVDKTHRFADEALERAYAAAHDFAKILKEHPVDGIRFVATSATRDAENRKEFEDNIESILSVRPEVIAGTEEAALSFLGATGSVSRAGLEAPYIVIDLGGGSTELVLGGDGESAPITAVQAAYSMDIGSVRMTERHLRHDPPTLDEIAEASKDIDRYLDEALEHVRVGRARTIIGVSGSVTTMTALVLGLKEYDHRSVDGVRVAYHDVFEVDDRFLNMTRAERTAYKIIHPGRVDVVGGGALIWNRVLARISHEVQEDHGQIIDSYVSSDHGLLDGIVLDYGKRLLQP
ncbi:exopolyphosphatase / guanosine-5'-triphosphate,3'-diphosphate pyrophosphatase [Bifidobacterium commune]|uniref:Exopolyphosphatase / guanosine-5'-triphosphate,3'-diphosphate pyrophosphatase n=2 Tax=Bifidobacterium commune TaxID=1505727 RepID=A0A1C4H2H6_9BIFI|nr:exopolyphosphatase / guanosine-5'-triphosphate,3'-diphosphate pyrophosphatase [Bifidobacterium commune]